MEAVIIIGCLLLSAFFSGMETAFVSANKIYLGVESRQTSFVSRVLTRLIENPVQFITAMLVGNSIALVVYGYHMSGVVLPLIPVSLPAFWQVILQVIVATFVILITAEFIPKVFFQVYANQLMTALAVPAYVFYKMFSWASRLLVPVANFVLVRFFGSHNDVRKAYFTKGELGAYISQQLTSKEAQDEVDAEIAIFKNALEFTSRKARDIMTLRTDISGVEIGSNVAVLRQLFIDTGYSKIVVYGRTVDNVLGYVHSFSLFSNPQSVAEVMVPIVRAPGTVLIKDLLNTLARRRKSMAVVLNEHGGTAGIVTVEDIVEELFGEIEDEHDEEQPLISEKLSDTTYRFSARLEVSEINKEYGLALPLGDSYNTLGGLLVHFSGSIPKEGVVLRAADYIFTVEKASGQKIELIRVELQRFK